MQSEAPESLGTPAQLPESHRASRRRLIIIIAVIVLLGGGGLAWRLLKPSEKPVSSASSSQSKTSALAKPDTSTPRINTQVVVSGRKHIWEIAFLPTGELLFNERGGTVNAIADGKLIAVAHISDVAASGEGGLLGLAVDPDFAQNRYIYTCYNSNVNDIRIVRWRLADDLKSLQDQQSIVTVVSAPESVYLGRHAGCRLAFGPDGYLWAGTGDNARGDTSIQPKNLGGKILRVDRSGAAAPGNLGGDYDSRIYSYGHRNVQGLAFFPSAKNGVLGLSAEHGPTVDDEVNELRKGNFGWAPPAQGYDESVPMTDLTRFPDAISAIWSSGNPTQAPAGAAVIKGKQWKGWDGALAVAMLKGQHLKILRLDDKNKVIKEEKTLVDIYGRLRAVVQGPDGALYIGTSNGNDEILKLSPE
jgi:glucose/arabinose dehydrogenase